MFSIYIQSLFPNSPIKWVSPLAWGGVKETGERGRDWHVNEATLTWKRISELGKVIHFLPFRMIRISVLEIINLKQFKTWPKLVRDRCNMWIQNWENLALNYYREGLYYSHLCINDSFIHRLNVCQNVYFVPGTFITYKVTWRIRNSLWGSVKVE